MGQTNATSAWLGGLLWPERVPVSEMERMLTARRIFRASASGRITEPQAHMRLARMPSARTRADLAALLVGVPGAAMPPALLAGTRVTAVAWVVLGIVQLIIWALIALISGGWDHPWWMWWVVGGAPVVAGMWWVFGRDHKVRGSDADERSRW